MNIKIYIASHTDCDFPESDVFTPIQTGCALSTRRFEGMVHDDTGENISDKNFRYCELTALYWAWKNSTADYIGLMHYRRHFVLNTVNAMAEDNWGSAVFDSTTPTYFDAVGMRDEIAEQFIPKYDVIVPVPWDVRKGKRINTLDQYKKSDYHFEIDYRNAQRVLLKKFPTMARYVNAYNKSYFGAFCNMLIMRRDILDAYCQWLFDILFDLEEHIDYTYYTKQETRALAYIGERLLGIYSLFLQNTPEIRFATVQRTFVNSIPKKNDVKKLPSEKAIPIALSFDSSYAPFASILIKSILINSNPDYTYDFYIINKQTTPESMRRIEIDLANYKNKKLRFLNLDKILSNYNFFIHKHFTEETYYRFFLPKLLPDLDKIIYLDCDVICIGDISNLYKTDISDNYIAAARDVQVLGEFKADHVLSYDYLTKIGMKNPYKYFQAGVLLLNLKKMRLISFTEKALGMVHEKYKYVDQDILNVICEDHVHYIEYAWNLMFDHDGTRISKYISNAPLQCYEEYMEARKAPFIIHYAGEHKPWSHPNEDYGEVFWSYARQSVWYEVVLKKMSPPLYLTLNHG